MHESVKDANQVWKYLLGDNLLGRLHLPKAERVFHPKKKKTWAPEEEMNRSWKPSRSQVFWHIKLWDTHKTHKTWHIAHLKSFTTLTASHLRLEICFFPRSTRTSTRSGWRHKLASGKTVVADNFHQLTVFLNHLGVSKNRGTPKWMVYNGKPY